MKLLKLGIPVIVVVNMMGSGQRKESAGLSWIFDLAFQEEKVSRTIEFFEAVTAYLFNADRYRCNL
jgi:hypothetical protein